MPRYRYRTRALLGPWRNTRERAVDDAVRAKQAITDKDEPRGFRWVVPGQIDEEKDEKSPEPVRPAIGA